MRFLTLSDDLSSKVDGVFSRLIEETVGTSLKKSFSMSTLEKAFFKGVKSQDTSFTGILTEKEFITLDLLKSYTKSSLMKAKEDFRHRFTTLMFKEKSSYDSSFEKSTYEILGESKSLHSRIISTMLNDAYQEGRSAGIRRSSSVENPLVFKRPRENACTFCKSLYLKKDGITPQVFTLNEMTEAGINNDGRHHHRPENTTWKAVVGSVHPWCRCVLHPLKKGEGFDEKGNVVSHKVKTFYW
tara:strand:+ start:74 stop:799 length:726 start_codon:yes stop_codon:yes gene_type:complete